MATFFLMMLEIVLHTLLYSTNKITIDNMFVILMIYYGTIFSLLLILKRIIMKKSYSPSV